jgi:hypothetical protein
MNTVAGGAKINRRQAVSRLAVLLAAGCWPGRLLGAAGPVAEQMRFVVANDFHHSNRECDAWFEKVFRQIGAHENVAFCAGLGDLADRGRPESLEAIRRLSEHAGVPFHPVPGNHDNDLESTTRIYDQIFPGHLNYHWTHAGWQFVAIDTTDGKAWGNTRVSAETLAWLDRTLPGLERERPTVLLTHFPLTPIRELCPVNAESVLERFVNFNLRAAFSGHYHGQTRVQRGACTLVTDVCCSRVAENHDGTQQKGYWLCDAGSDGTVNRTFVELVAS